ncbi:MAG: WecB/TagA/CpsF family glycosyltransferase [Cyanobacteria bacterium P01_A01_bin.83]
MKTEWYKILGAEVNLLNMGQLNSLISTAVKKDLKWIIGNHNLNILMVGMGMPRQEKWILDNIEDIEANIILPSGACADYVADETPTPPRWMGQVGLEWLYRLVIDPKRLWRRYLVEPWFLAKLFLKEFTQRTAW